MLKLLKYLLFIILIIILANSCQQTLVKKENKSTEVDSSFFFKQVEIHDPFLDKLAANPNQSFALKKTFIPPPPPEPEKPKFKTIEGYRVQIFAGVDSINAFLNINLAQNVVMDTIYLLNEKGLYKLQVGDYPYYPQADSIKRIFRQTNFPGAWIVQTNILIPFIESKLDSTVDTISIDDSGKYKIQIIATGDENKAKNIVIEMKRQFNFNSFYEVNGNIFKVFIGYYNTEDEARKVLEIIRNEKYPDAWMVYKKE